MPVKPQPILSAEHAAFMQGARSIVAAAFDRDGQAAMTRGLGCRLPADRDSVLLVLNATQSAALLAAIESSRRIAVALSDPPTHLALQIKGIEARCEEVAAAELEAIAQHHLEIFTACVQPLGHSRDVVRAVLRGEPGPLVAVRFIPEAVFEQTPGPRAGVRLP